MTLVILVTNFPAMAPGVPFQVSTIVWYGVAEIWNSERREFWAGALGRIVLGHGQQPWSISLKVVD